MAYGRYSRRRRAYTRRRPGTRSIRRTPRRTTTRYRRTRTTTRRPRLMSRRGINDLTSKKKKDNMLTYTNVQVPRTNLNYAQLPAVLQGGGPDYHFLWAATARTNEVGPGAPGEPGDDSTRSASTVYMKGLRERVDMALNSARPWVWRRIVFTMKGFNNTFTPVTGANFFVLTSSGYGRLVNDMTATQRNQAQAIIFDGTKDVDWNDVYNAKTDSNIITVRSDTTTIIKPKTTAGDIQNRRFYYPFEKNFVYGDDEIGGEQGHSAWSTLGKPGMGDVLVYDMISPGAGSVFGDTLSINIQATLYWHEK